MKNVDKLLTIVQKEINDRKVYVEAEEALLEIKQLQQYKNELEKAKDVITKDIEKYKQQLLVDKKALEDAKVKLKAQEKDALDKATERLVAAQVTYDNYIAECEARKDKARFAAKDAEKELVAIKDTILLAQTEYSAIDKKIVEGKKAVESLVADKIVHAQIKQEILKYEQILNKMKLQVKSIIGE